MELSNLRVVVTGAAGGLGRSAVEFFLRHGALVGAVDHNAMALTQMQTQLTAHAPSQLRAYGADVSNEQQVIDTVRRAGKDLGRINALVNHAGIYLDGLLIGSDGFRFPTAQWRRVIDVDLTGTFLMTREVVAAMVESGTRPGVVVNIASISRH